MGKQCSKAQKGGEIPTVAFFLPPPGVADGRPPALLFCLPRTKFPRSTVTDTDKHTPSTVPFPQDISRYSERVPGALAFSKKKKKLVGGALGVEEVPQPASGIPPLFA